MINATMAATAAMLITLIAGIAAYRRTFHSTAAATRIVLVATFVWVLIYMLLAKIMPIALFVAGVSIPYAGFAAALVVTKMRGRKPVDDLPSVSSEESFDDLYDPPPYVRMQGNVSSNWKDA